jgi:hypothetical protein
MERIILYPNTPEFELFEKLKPIMKEQVYEAFKAGFKRGHTQVSNYNEEQIERAFKIYSKNSEPVEVKHLTFED